MPARSSVYSINNTEMQKVLSFAARTCFFSWFINRFLENNRGDRHLFEAVSWYWFPYNLISSAHFVVVVANITVSGTDSDSHLGATRSLCFLPGNGCWNEIVHFSYCLSALTVYKPTFQTSSGWSAWVWSLRWEDALEKRMATHSSILAWRIPMDRGAWQATVHGVAKSRTWLSD